MVTPLITRDAEESVNFLRRYLFLQAFPCRALYRGDNRIVILFSALAGELANLLGEQRVFNRNIFYRKFYLRYIVPAIYNKVIVF